MKLKIKIPKTDSHRDRHIGIFSGKGSLLEELHHSAQGWVEMAMARAGLPWGKQGKGPININPEKVAATAPTPSTNRGATMARGAATTFHFERPAPMPLENGNAPALPDRWKLSSRARHPEKTGSKSRFVFSVTLLNKETIN